MQLQEVKGRVDFGIITIREDEFEAVLERFPEAGRVTGRREYNLRRVEVAGGSYLVAVVCCVEQGNGMAQSAANDLLEELAAHWLLVVGIAGGVPSVEFGLGDVVVSTRIHDFSVEAVLQDGRTEYSLAGGPVDKRAAILAANFPAMKAQLGDWNTARSVAVERPAVSMEVLSSTKRRPGDESWREEVRAALHHHLGRTGPSVRAGPIASSDRLIKDAERLKVWRTMARHVLAIEMESAGVYQATYGRQVPMLAVRGISDIVGLKRDPAWTRYACHTAAAFALALVKTRPFEPRATHARFLPDYADAASRELGEKLADASWRKARLEEAGAETTSIKEEILGLRRQLREGGQLREGDTLGDGRYLLLRRLGRGGFATVWEARDQKHRQQVAIKVLHSELAREPMRRERFFRGARVMSELVHEAIVKVLEPHGHDGGFYYFVMELVPGGDFRTAVLKGQVRAEAVLPLILRVGEALALAHQRKFIHRDIKPSNILLDAEGNPRLTDFDLVGGVDTTGGTRTGALGTFLYAAPELMDRPQDADARADVYGLGMTALFGLHGRELSQNVIQDTEKRKLISRLPCPEEVKKVLQRAASRAHDKRYPHALKFCRALEEAREAVNSVEVAPTAPSMTPESGAWKVAPVQTQALLQSKLTRVRAFPSLRAAVDAARLAGKSARGRSVEWLHLPLMEEGEGLFAVRAPLEVQEGSRQPIRAGDWLVMRYVRSGEADVLEGDVGLIRVELRDEVHDLMVVSRNGEWRAPPGSTLRPISLSTEQDPVALLVESVAPERLGPERGASLAPQRMMEAFGLEGIPTTGRHGGHLFLCISEKGALVEPDRIHQDIADPRPAETAFVLMSHEPQRTWRYWGVAGWSPEEQCWVLSQPVDHATWRELSDKKSTCNRLPPEAEARAQAWADKFLQRHRPGTFIENNGKRCRFVGRAAKGGIRVDGGGKGGFKERTVSLLDLAWALIARDDARKTGGPLDEARVNRLRFLEGTPKDSTRWIDTGWALVLLANE